MWPISSWCTYKKNAPNKRKEFLKAPSTPNSKQIFSQINKCLVLLLGQNIFCPGQNWNCPRQNFCLGLKTTLFAFKSHAKWIFVVENRFPIRKFCFKWLLKAKNVLHDPGQNFYLGQFQFCPGQKIFCPSRRTRHNCK